MHAGLSSVFRMIVGSLMPQFNFILLTTSMVPDSSAAFVVNRTVTLSVFSTPNNAAVSTFHQTSTPNASTTLDVVASSAVNRKATPTTSTSPKDAAASVIYQIANTIAYIFQVVVNVVAAAIDYTTASTSTDTTSTESTCPSNRPTVNQTMVEFTEGSNVHIERLKLYTTEHVRRTSVNER
ncbi:hypothetical protein KQX54_015248 [Cotesia glomerata]|uniref:Uncharacterized protein n=1 Tax=Cotesia glomerata TaxID=32391 RepID=A0AAV7J4G5_COTGL|nr:hypothetical protein KQX54_015248 [Cotesia glomerata]